MKIKNPFSFHKSFILSQADMWACCNPQREGTKNVQHDDKRGFPMVFTP